MSGDVLKAVANLGRWVGVVEMNAVASVGVPSNGKSMREAFDSLATALAEEMDSPDDADRAALLLLDAGHKLSTVVDVGENAPELNAWHQATENALELLGVLPLAKADD